MIEAGGTHWTVEGKVDEGDDLGRRAGKRAIAKRWANYVAADATVGTTCLYLLVAETDVETAKGSLAGAGEAGQLAAMKT